MTCPPFSRDRTRSRLSKPQTSGPARERAGTAQPPVACARDLQSHRPLSSLIHETMGPESGPPPGAPRLPNESSQVRAARTEILPARKCKFGSPKGKTFDRMTPKRCIKNATPCVRMRLRVGFRLDDARLTPWLSGDT